jgi:hypothetical protein
MGWCSRTAGNFGLPFQGPNRHNVLRLGTNKPMALPRDLATGPRSAPPDGGIGGTTPRATARRWRACCRGSLADRPEIVVVYSCRGGYRVGGVAGSWPIAKRCWAIEVLRHVAPFSRGEGGGGADGPGRRRKKTGGRVSRSTTAGINDYTNTAHGKNGCD